MQRSSTALHIIVNLHSKIDNVMQELSKKKQNTKDKFGDSVKDEL